jgi:ABC-2 type transport system ATP-binding protein
MTVPVRPAIAVRHLWHSFGRGHVLRDVSFTVAPGEIFGFIGPNGAGKTTTIRTLATLLEPSAGVVEVDGIDVTLDPVAVRRILGYMPDHAGVYERITVREYLEFFAAACGARPAVVDAVLELTDLGELSDKLVASFSKGMRQRLGLARVLLHDPKVLVLDEPASDLDPRARIEIRDLLLELRRLGKTILVSSHILSELSDVCTSVGILEKGRLLAAGPMDRITSALEARRAAAATPSAGPPDPAAPPDALRAASGERRRLRIRVLGEAAAAARAIPVAPPLDTLDVAAGGWLTLHHYGDDRFVADTVQRLVLAGVRVVAVEPERNELERIFLEVTKGQLQ